jgi:hypothetical protein
VKLSYVIEKKKEEIMPSIIHPKKEGRKKDMPSFARWKLCCMVFNLLGFRS